jgi:uncharacterized protein (TIGR03118 family)
LLANGTNLVATGVPVSLAAGLTLNSAAVATFTDPAGADALSNYSASINWGDGTSASAGTVSVNNGTFTVAGSHTYAADVASNVTVSISDTDGASGTATTTAQAGFLQLSLAADRSQWGMITDTNLVNPWGVAFSATSPFWVADNNANVATIYAGDVAGSPFGKAPLTVTIPTGAPTGVVFNGTSDFSIGGGASAGPATFIFASENGDISAWNGNLSPITQALTEATSSTAVYKGLAMESNAGANFLYAANFHDDSIDVYDTNFKPVTLGSGSFTGTFSDPNIPTGFAPFDIKDFGGKLYVTYAMQNAAKHDDVAGPGNGFVDVFDTAGNLLQRLIVGKPGDATSPLNSPWGLAMAPAGDGDFGGDLLVGNFGDGKIHAFDPTTGALLGVLSDPAGNPISIDGLWTLTFGNGGKAGDASTLFFTAGQNHEADGLFGSLQTAFQTPLAGTGATFAATEGSAFSGTVATFNDVGGLVPTGFSAMINWGDGLSSAGTITADLSGGLDVSGSHVYTEETTAAAQVTVTDAAHNTITINAQGNVADAPLAGKGLPVVPTQGVTVSNMALATFTDSGGAEPTSDYTATIDWGDNTTTTSGTVTVSGSTFTVSGSHTYATAVAHTITITIADDGGATLAVTTTTTVPGSGYVVTNLVSNTMGGALIQDPLLVNPWGLAVSPTGGDFWVADNGTSVATLYGGDVAGSALVRNQLVVKIPGGSPTGAVFNASSDFVINGANGSKGPATFIFASQTGNIVGWNASVPPPTPSRVGQIAATVAGADFTGLAIGQDSSGHNLLFVTDFQSGKIDVFDAGFNPTTLAGSFADPNLPTGFAPFNVEDIGGKLYVTYAKQQVPANDPSAPFVPATTGGIVDVFDTAGNLVQRFSNDSHLNAPWGMALAPSNFGQFSGDILVGDFGDGRIDAFKSDGTFDGQLADGSGNPISIEGLRGLSFGNGVSAGNSNSLFFTSQPGGTTPEATSVLLLDPSGQGALSAVGNSTVTVLGGGELVVGSNNAAAVVAMGTSLVQAPEFDITSTTVLNNPNVVGKVNVGVPALADPMASLAVPTQPSATFGPVNATGQMVVILEPGTYTGGISVSGQATVRLEPGLYFIEDGGLSATDTGKILGDGVTVYLATPSGGGTSNGIVVSGHGTIGLTAPNGDTDPMRGVAIFQARDNAAAISVSGNGTLMTTGTIYAAGAGINVSDSGEVFILDGLADGITAQVVASDLHVSGSGDFDMRGVPASGKSGLFGVINVATTTPLTVTGANLSFVEGHTTVRDVATFMSTTAGATASDFTATIDWGDGSSSAGTVSATGGGNFLVIAQHTYAEEGTDSVTVTISDKSGNTATVTETATAIDAPLMATGVSITGGTTSTPSTLVVSDQVVATFVDSGGAEPIADYTATIDWGDGSSTSSGTVALTSGSTFNVSGSHTYTASGRFTASVSIKDDGGAKATATTIVINGHSAADDSRAFVEAAFADLLGRSADSGGLSTFTGAIAGGMSPAAAAGVMTNSNEFLEGVIQQAYRNYLGRSAESGGLQFWLSQMRQGLTDARLDADFIGSPEFFNHTGGSNTAWVNEMYFDLLGRAPDTGGLAFWVNALTHGIDRVAIASGFAGSLEHLTAMIQADYRTYLGRAASQAEVNAWVRAFEQGLTNEQIIAGFVGSHEFFEQQIADD